MKKYLTYLACPYTVKSCRPGGAFSKAFVKKLELVRANAATKAAVFLIETKGWNVFSPITHSQPMHHVGGMVGNWEFWKQIDTEYLKLSCRLVVLCIPGWKESTGVQDEIKIAEGMGIPVLFLTKSNGEYELRSSI